MINYMINPIGKKRSDKWILVKHIQIGLEGEVRIYDREQFMIPIDLCVSWKNVQRLD